MASASGWPYNKPLVINHQMDAPKGAGNGCFEEFHHPDYRLRHKLQYRLKEGALIALGAMCLYLLMALLTYNVADPAWDNSVQVERIINAGGSIGAWLSSALFGALGYFAYIFPSCWPPRPGRCFAPVINPGTGTAGCFPGTASVWSS